MTTDTGPHEESGAGETRSGGVSAALLIDQLHAGRPLIVGPLSGVNKVRRALATGTIHELVITVAISGPDLESMACFVAGDDFDGVSLEGGGDFFLIGLENDIAPQGWVELSQDPAFGGDGSRRLLALPGADYPLGVEWRNGDFYEPFTAQEFEQALKDYDPLY